MSLKAFDAMLLGIILGMILAIAMITIRNHTVEAKCQKRYDVHDCEFIPVTLDVAEKYRSGEY
ncbi:hypothetical protein SUFG_00062 [Sulfitobacter phage phiCB2047-B]|uniref:Uncharacterized protein n=1 Tax=Sulfitobacter phage phiCB2047-B TaxID=754046 RepID=M4PYJ3_9CAUD|nr:hypothetical protein SUFG_00062 [Sulfitobacter phage phiCB2047-B]AGH07429.1 hypothetical protein SUFG_00062 [Sulfitobacter phage phiCB2047-B]